jgi:uncharacterized protein with von Willebrand factor type A (vWA) domain
MASDPVAGLTAGVGALAGGMRRRGARVGLGQLLLAHEALAAVDAADRADAYAALRSALCSGRSDLALFDAAFDELLASGAARARDAGSETHGDPALALSLPGVAVPAQEDGDPDVASHPLPAAWSDTESLRHADFAELGAEQMTRLRELLRPLARRGALRPSRRTRAVRRRTALTTDRLDLRRTIRASLRYGGEPLERHWRDRRMRPRRLVFVLDVSGSMRPYAEGLVHYVQGFVTERPRVEAFVFGTRLTRVTRELSSRDPATALARAAEAVTDWSGGTRIGPALGQLNREHGRRLGRGAIVVILSDGWDRGDADELSRELARLHRSANRLVWLNPLKARAGYEPLTRGMQAALPHLDLFLAGNSVASLEQLGQLLELGLAAPAALSPPRGGRAGTRPARA